MKLFSSNVLECVDCRLTCVLISWETAHLLRNLDPEFDSVGWRWQVPRIVRTAKLWEARSSRQRELLKRPWPWFNIQWSKAGSSELIFCTDCVDARWDYYNSRDDNAVALDSKRVQSFPMQVSLIFGKTFLREVRSQEIDRKTTPHKAGLLYRLALAAIECWSNPSDGFWAWLTLLSYYWKRQRILWESQFLTNNLWMFHCDEDYLSSIGGIEHHLVLNHLGSFTRMASQTRWVNTNSWENSFKSLFSHNAWFGLMGTFQKSLLADTLQTKKISICQFLRDGELWNSRWCWFLFLKVLNLDAKTFESNWSSAPISLAAILAKKQI